MGGDCPCLVGVRGACWNHKCRALRKTNDTAGEVDFEFTLHHEASVSFFTPMGLHKLRGQLKKPYLPGAFAKDFEARTYLRRLPLKLIKEDCVRFHVVDWLDVSGRIGNSGDEPLDCG